MDLKELFFNCKIIKIRNCDSFKEYGIFNSYINAKDEESLKKKY